MKKPGTGVMEVRRGATSPRTMKRVQGSDKPTPKPRVTTKPKKTPRKLTPAQKLAIAGGTIGGVAALVGSLGEKKTATADPNKKRRASPGGVNKGKDPVKPKKGPSTGRPPLGGPSDGRKKKGPSTGRPPLGGPSGGAKPKKITAGKGTGFGPKGNIFPSNAAERAALMLMYGGTGSAAAKAAAAGKQGNLKLGKAAYEKAKKDRLKKKK